MDLTNLPKLGDFLGWLGTAGAFALIMANVLEKIPNWANLNTNLKTAIALGIALGLGVGSAAATTWIPTGVKPDADAVYRIVFNAVTIWLASQYAHARMNSAPTPTLTDGTTGANITTKTEVKG